MTEEKHIVKIKEVYKITHNVKSFVTERPDNYNFEPGQATEVAINKEDWKDEGRPFTFTSLAEDPFLQFMIKIYPNHHGVTNQMQDLKPGDELILHDVFGAINYQGKGTFIAGGAGITPFIAIFRYLKQKNALRGHQLIFANQTKKDIIIQKELEDYFKKNFINILSEENSDKYAHGLITQDFLNKHIINKSEKVYLCGPPPMNETVKEQLLNMGIENSNLIMEGI